MTHWKYYKELGDLKDVGILHIDTRGFDVLPMSDTLSDLPTPLETIDEKDIPSWIENLERETGGHGVWRKILGVPGWGLKYIRLFRIPGTTKFIVCDRHQTPISLKGLEIKTEGWIRKFPIAPMIDENWSRLTPEYHEEVRKAYQGVLAIDSKSVILGVLEELFGKHNILDEDERY